MATMMTLIAHDLELDGIAGSIEELAVAPPLTQEEAVESQVREKAAHAGIDAHQIFDEEEGHVVPKVPPEVEAYAEVWYVDEAQVEQLVE